MVSFCLCLAGWKGEVKTWNGEVYVPLTGPYDVSYALFLHHMEEYGLLTEYPTILFTVLKSWGKNAMNAVASVPCILLERTGETFLLIGR